MLLLPSGAHFWLNQEIMLGVEKFKDQSRFFAYPPKLKKALGVPCAQNDSIVHGVESAVGVFSRT